jgi:hypothetical protein
MSNSIFRMICRLLIASMMLMSFTYARATMIGADQLSAPSPGALADRAAVAQMLSRADVAQQLQSLGIEPKAALERVNAMTDEEVHALAGQVNSLPAGASGSWGWWVAAVVVIAIVVWYMYK